MIPIKAQHQHLPKHEFMDAIRLRLGMNPQETPTKYACGRANSVVHAKSCHLGGFMKMRHDKVRDYLHQKAALVFHDTESEPHVRHVEDQILNPGVNLA